ncbi:cytochrome b/b6 domain-containing protein [Microbacterium testaceum]|uniref:cytochrome b/b6 domain-containing protein n=1 Tax=Microbacterium testaceum TaxID=2033 RepID=UPI0022DF727F|nr:cytochrome b/b6 domain-containing protein [Microbacterium testaceum]
MASTPRFPRRGLPRVPGGQPWPPAGADVTARPDGAPDAHEPEGVEPQAPSRSSVAPDVAPPAPASTGAETRDVRRGLPREPGGEPWPPASVASPDGMAPAAGSSAGSAPGATSGPPPGADAAAGAPVDAVPPAAGRTDAATDGVRRGLPREPGGEPWPPVSAGPVGAAEAAPREASASHEALAPREASAPRADPGPSEAPAPREATAPRPPLTVRRTVWPGAAARKTAAGAAPAPTAGRAARPSVAAPPPGGGARLALGDYSPVQLLGSAAVLGVFALALAGIAVLLARFVLAIGPGREFLAAFPGEYPLPASAPVSLPVWLNVTHFLNSLFLLLIIRTGWQVRREKRPTAFWSPRANKKRRISLTLWFHQALDILWIANGVIFVVLLFVTGQWMRIVPTSWEVFPNAVSAALQYASLDWPTENGWVSYNSLQQLSYFAITFVAAPLAIVSGVRLSGVWPKDADKLNRLYPAEWARRVHFPTMLFFVAFIAVHVFLVLATGALRNLNHMYAARGAVDPEAYTTDPTGLLLFAASLLVMAAAWVAARPAVLVPIARLFGDVKQR